MNELVEKIKLRDKKGFLEELKSLEKNNEIIICLVNLYTGFCGTDRIEPLKLFYKSLAEYQKKKSINGLNVLCKLVFTHYSYPFPFEYDNPEDYSIDLMGVLYRKQRDVSELDSYRDVIEENIIGLLDVLWDALIKGGSKGHNLAMKIPRFILEKVSKKDLYKKGVLLSQEKIDSYDLLMNFVTHFVESFHFDEGVKKYITICKELFYFKCRIKDRPWRAHIIYGCFHVLSKRGLTVYETRETDANEMSLKKNSFQYLKAITRVDTNLINEVRSHKHNLNAPIYYSKAITVDHGGGYLNTFDRRPSVIVNKN